MWLCSAFTEHRPDSFNLAGDVEKSSCRPSTVELVQRPVSLSLQTPQDCSCWSCPVCSTLRTRVPPPKPARRLPVAPTRYGTDCIFAFLKTPTYSPCSGLSFLSWGIKSSGWNVACEQRSRVYTRMPTWTLIGDDRWVWHAGGLAAGRRCLRFLVL